MAEAKVVQVIEVSMLRGRGIEEDPTRIVHLYFTFEGQLLAENDPLIPPLEKMRGEPSRSTHDAVWNRK